MTDRWKVASRSSELWYRLYNKTRYVMVYQGRSQAEAEEAAASSDSGAGKQKF